VRAAVAIVRARLQSLILPAYTGATGTNSDGTLFPYRNSRYTSD
jgi:hypothetical protein